MREPASLRAPVDPALRRLRITAILGVVAMLFVVVPVLNQLGVVPDSSVNRLGRYLCIAIAVIGVDLVWGFTGMLSLCQAVFFCLGGYAMAMHLSLPEGGGDVRPEYGDIPQFLFFANPGSDQLPAFWEPFRSLWFTVAAAIVIPTLAAALFGFFVLRSRVKGVYFAIITQAAAWGVFLAFNRNEMLLGGTNGLTNFYKPLNMESAWILGLYLITCVALCGTMLGVWAITRSRLGRILAATRDCEMRLYFAGYRPELYKIFAFAVAAAVAALGGMLYVPQNGIITPNTMRVEDSILLVVCVALGGRGTLLGAAAGGLTFYYLQSTLTSDMPSLWPFILGLSIVAIVLFLPGGMATLWQRIEEQVDARRGIGHILLAATPLAAVTLFLLAQVLNLMPRMMNVPSPVFGLHWKYVTLVAVLTLSAGAGWFIGRRSIRATDLDADAPPLSPPLAEGGTR